MCKNVYTMPIKRILFLDDDPQIEIFYKKLLEHICPGNGVCGGGVCDTCFKYFTTYDEFIRNAKAGDIVVLDFVLGTIKNGIDVAKELKKKFGESVTVIFFSSFINRDTKREDIKQYSDYIIPKSELKSLIKLIDTIEQININNKKGNLSWNSTTN